MYKTVKLAKRHKFTRDSPSMCPRPSNIKTPVLLQVPAGAVREPARTTFHAHGALAIRPGHVPPLTVRESVLFIFQLNSECW